MNYTVTYDDSYGQFYIYNKGVTPGTIAVFRTHKIKAYNSVYADLDAKGKIIGIEVLNGDEITVAEVMKLFKD